MFFGIESTSSTGPETSGNRDWEGGAAIVVNTCLNMRLLGSDFIPQVLATVGLRVYAVMVFLDGLSLQLLTTTLTLYTRTRFGWNEPKFISLLLLLGISLSFSQVLCMPSGAHVSVVTARGQVGSGRWMGSPNCSLTSNPTPFPAPPPPLPKGSDTCDVQPPIDSLVRVSRRARDVPTLPSHS